jgi:hypothetical protein
MVNINPFQDRLTRLRSPAPPARPLAHMRCVTALGLEVQPTLLLADEVIE